MSCGCVLNQPVAAMYLSVWGMHVGSDNGFCMLRAFRQRVLIMVCWCFAWAMHESRKCCIGIAVAFML